MITIRDRRLQRDALIVIALVACHPKPVTYPSYFDNAYKNQPTAKPITCHDLLGCYTRCDPFTDECQAACDRGSSPDLIVHAHDAETCIGRSSCADDTCMQARCGTELAACP